MRTTGLERTAMVLVGLEALALLVLTGWELVGVVTGTSGSVPDSVALIVLTGLAALALGAFAVGVGRGKSWARSGAVVAQVLLGAVAVAALTDPGIPSTVAPLTAVPAVVTFVVLLLAARAAGRRFERADD